MTTILTSKQIKSMTLLQIVELTKSKNINVDLKGAQAIREKIKENG